MANREFLELFDGHLALGVLAAALLTSFSCSLLVAWLFWFRRHRDLYNLRNETLHRIEQELGMYHFLRVVEADTGDDDQLRGARTRAGHDALRPFYKPQLRGPSGYKLALVLVPAFVALEFATLLVLVVTVNR